MHMLTVCIAFRGWPHIIHSFRIKGQNPPPMCDKMDEPRDCDELNKAATEDRYFRIPLR